MHIELIGSTSAGKTTIAKKMVEVGTLNGMEIFLSDDFMLNWARLNWIKNEFIRRRIVELIAFMVCAMTMNRYKEFLEFVFSEGQYSTGSWLYRINRIRNVIRKIGIYEFIIRNSEEQQMILADNEGIMQGVHNLYVHQGETAELERVSRYVDRIPLPDIVLYLRQDGDVLISRTLARGHGRVNSTRDEVVHFIQQAVAVFEELIRIPKVQERLLILNADFSVQRYDQGLKNNNFHQVIELLQLDDLGAQSKP